jgi:dTDP-4-dehydrorhamnose 3,5-epimerase-like enzyme
MYELVELKELSNNENGSTHEFAAIQSEGYLLATRKAGTLSGNHYHKGQSLAKNPESLLLVQGKVKLNVKSLDTGDNELRVIDAPIIIRIKPSVIHTLEALTDIIFIEFNSLEEHKSDTYYLA